MYKQRPGPPGPTERCADDGGYLITSSSNFTTETYREELMNSFCKKKTTLKNKKQKKLTYRILSIASRLHRHRGHRFSITQTHRVYRRHAWLHHFVFVFNKMTERLTIKSSDRVGQGAKCCCVWMMRRSCVPWTDSLYEAGRENVTLAGWTAGLSTMCSLVAQWKISGRNTQTGPLPCRRDAARR